MNIDRLPAAMAALVLCCILLFPLASIAAPRAELEERGIAFTAHRFVKSAAKGDLESVRLFLAAGMDVNAKNKRGDTALIGASVKGHKDIVKLLLEKNADVNANNNKGDTALMEASYKGHANTVKLLLAKGVDVDAANSDGGTALMYAALKGQSKIVKALLASGADPDIRNNKGKTALDWATGKRHRKTAQLLQGGGKAGPASGANPRAELEKRGKPFTADAFVYGSARTGDLEAVKLFLAAKMDVDAIFDVGYTALIFAAKGGHSEIVKLLLDRGADVNHAPEFGDTALKWAAKKGHPGIVRLLIEKGADINDASGGTALMNAAGNGHMEIVGLLLAKGADINARDGAKQTALFRAAERGHGGIVALLLEKGADPNAKDDAGATPLQMARQNGHEAVVKLLQPGSATAQQRIAITGKNWLTHPEIKKVRVVYKKILALRKGGKLRREERAFQYCQGHNDKWELERDAAGIVRFYASKSGGDHFFIKKEQYYDSKGRLRFAFIMNESDEWGEQTEEGKPPPIIVSKTEERIYLDEAGEMFWGVFKTPEGNNLFHLHITKEAGDFVSAPDEAFQADGPCPELPGKKGMAKRISKKPDKPLMENEIKVLAAGSRELRDFVAKWKRLPPPRGFRREEIAKVRVTGNKNEFYISGDMYQLFLADANNDGKRDYILASWGGSARIGGIVEVYTAEGGKPGKLKALNFHMAAENHDERFGQKFEFSHVTVQDGTTYLHFNEGTELIWEEGSILNPLESVAEREVKLNMMSAEICLHESPELKQKLLAGSLGFEVVDMYGFRGEASSTLKSSPNPPTRPRPTGIRHRDVQRELKYMEGKIRWACRYGAVKAMDGNPKTAWSEGKPGDGIGELLLVIADTGKPVRIWAGFGYSKKIFIANNRPRKVRVYVAEPKTGGSATQYSHFEAGITVLASHTVELRDYNGYQDLPLPRQGQGVGKQYIGIEILSVYRGNKYRDTCISEVGNP